MVSSNKLIVGIPVQNGERFIEEALSCALGQSFRDFSILVSDNASTDRTPQIVRSIMDVEERVIYHRQHCPVDMLTNFEFLAATARSEYFTWLAADDLWSKGWLEAHVRGLESHPERVGSFGRVVPIDADGNELPHHPAFDANFPLIQEGRHARRLRYIQMSEHRGKANLWYGVYRTPTLAKVLSSLTARDRLTDIQLPLAMLDIGPIGSEPEECLFKRLGESGHEHLPAIGPLAPEVVHLIGLWREVVSLTTHEGSGVCHLNFLERLLLNVRRLRSVATWYVNRVSQELGGRF